MNIPVVTGGYEGVGYDPNFLITEYFVNFEEFGKDIAKNPFQVENGYIEKQAADIINPDVCNVGGILELKEIAAMAEPYYGPHNTGDR